MIDRNIGTPERVVRALLGVGLIAWVIVGERFAGPQVAALLAAFALLWNSIFSRCYLWNWLGISSCKDGDEGCPRPGGGSKA
jgi:hypothetical protein